MDHSNHSNFIRKAVKEGKRRDNIEGEHSGARFKDVTVVTVPPPTIDVQNSIIDIPDATSRKCLVRAIINNRKLAAPGELGTPVGKPFLVELEGVTEAECLGNLDTVRYHFERWW